MHTLCNCTWGSTQLKYTHTNEMKLNTVFRVLLYQVLLTRQGRAMHICISKLTIIGSDNGLLPGRCQTMIWTNDGILLIWILGTNSSEILSKIHTFSFKKIHLKVSSVKWRPFCLRFNVSNQARASLRQWISGWYTPNTGVWIKWDSIAWPGSWRSYAQPLEWWSSLYSSKMKSNSVTDNQNLFLVTVKDPNQLTTKTQENRTHINIKTVFPRYGDSHVKDKMVARPYYL